MFTLQCGWMNFQPLLCLVERMSAVDCKHDIGSATKLYTTLYRRIMSACCRRDCNDGHCREEMMEKTLMRIKRTSGYECGRITLDLLNLFNLGLLLRVPNR